MISGMMLEKLSEDESARVERKLRVAIEEFVAICEIRGGYMPACATVLRIIADDLADRYPDDTNGGRKA